MSAQDDPFNEIVAGLEFTPPTDVVNVSALSDASLISKYHDVCDALLKSKRDLLRPTTEWGTHQHSLKDAIQDELARRKLL